MQPEFYTTQLLKNLKVLDYLEQRGVGINLIMEFQLGWLEKGQFIQNLYGEGIVFPIFDFNSNVVECVMRKEGCEQKYLWTKDSNKGKYLYGLNKTWKDIMNAGYVVLVEGFFDFLVLYSKGIKNVASPMTNNLGLCQGWMLSCFCNNAIFIFDGDNKRGSLRGRKYIDVVEKKIPFDLDPDEFVLKNGIESFKKYVI